MAHGERLGHTAAVTPVIVYALTALAAVDLALTRRRLLRDGTSGRAAVGGRWLDAHTYLGAGAVVVWTVFLAGPDGTLPGNALVGLLGLGLWWVTSLAGLVLLSRWLPRRGRHASDDGADSWVRGPGLSVLAHGGMLLGVLVFTWAYATSAV